MKKAIIGAVLGAGGVLVCKEIYLAGYSKGIDTGVELCKNLISVAFKIHANASVEEES